MKRMWKPWLFILITVFALLNLLCYFAIRPMWSGIIRYLGQPAPYLLLLLNVVSSLLGVILCMRKRYSPIAGIFLILESLFFFIGDAYIISLTTEAYVYFIREFLYGLAFVLFLAVLMFLLFGFPKTKLYSKAYIKPVVLLLMFAVFLVFYFQIGPNKITSTPVVYAVGDDYQIVFTSQIKGTGWVTVNGKEYNDTYSGYRTTERTVHKITVPMSELDTAGEYTISTRSMLLRGPYCSLQGKTINKTYHWKGVDTSDGINYYVLSDIHNATKCPDQAATYFGDALDFLITCGDNVSWIDRTSDLTEFQRLAGRITKGKIPVIYARGNHETKGVKAHELYQYVGCDDQKFYYTFRLQNIWGIVLDLGEDHADDFIEYYGAAKFADYRTQQIQFLDDVLANRDTEFDAPGVDYRIAVCHIPVTMKDNNDYAGEVKDAWIPRLNQMKLTMLFSGHFHELMYIDDAFTDNSVLMNCEEYSGKTNGNSTYIMTAAEFPNILVSRKSVGQQLTYPETVLDTHYIGLAVTVDQTNTTMQYTNEDHKVVGNIISPWFSDITYGDKIVVPNK